MMLARLGLGPDGELPSQDGSMCAVVPPTSVRTLKT